MKNEQKILTCLYGASILVSSFRILKTIQAGREDRRQIRSDGESEIEAIHKAGDIVQEKLANGDYRGKSVHDLLEDLNFYTIVSRPVREE
jgi:hypothetical protein